MMIQHWVMRSQTVRIWHASVRKLDRSCQQNSKCRSRPVYIVGSEVPIPGALHRKRVPVCKLKISRLLSNLEDTLRVEVGLRKPEGCYGCCCTTGYRGKDDGCTEYDRRRLQDLMASIKEHSNLIFEGHCRLSTKSPRELIEDGVGILKVGPGQPMPCGKHLVRTRKHRNGRLSWKRRSAQQLYRCSEEAMMGAVPKNWKALSRRWQRLWFKRKYSFWPQPLLYAKSQCCRTSDKLIANLRKSGILERTVPVHADSVYKGLEDI